MSHTCHAKNCKTNCKPEYLMCPRHWRMVSRSTQNAVYRYYQPGQCDLDPIPSEKWHAAADVAIAEVARKENIISEEGYNRIINQAREVLKK